MPRRQRLPEYRGMAQERAAGFQGRKKLRSLRPSGESWRDDI